jgi:hypothetical protein
MKFHYCPHIKQLGRELIEAYRRNDKKHENLTTESSIRPSEDVISNHHAITQHRAACTICREIHDSLATTAIDPRLPST